ncbi:hypothetical protein [Aliarcobacter butzleri]|uniref:hypothetical protein n=1 Tax=Aliarcobacter butzleri TaxID=28197 RepID=UPI0026485E58|nr:hypothetical protein [Aliarcobacter butzleri]
MKTGLMLLIDNFTYILLFMLISIIFLILYNKYFNKEEKEDNEKFTQREISTKNLYLNRIDIIGNKIGTIFVIIILIIVSIIFFLLK